MIALVLPLVLSSAASAPFESTAWPVVSRGWAGIPDRQPGFLKLVRNGRVLVRDRNLSIVDTRDWSQGQRPLPEGMVDQFDVDDAGRLVVAWTYETVLASDLWNAKWRLRQSAVPGEGRIDAAVAAPNGAFVLVAQESTLLCLDAKTLARRWTLRGRKGDFGYTGRDGYAISPDSKWVAAPYNTGIRLRDTATGRTVWKRGGASIFPSFSPSGKVLTFWGSRLESLDLASRRVKSTRVGKNVNALCMLDDRTVAVGYSPRAFRPGFGGLRVFRLGDPRPLFETRVDKGGVALLTYSTATRMLVAASREGKFVAWKRP